jgi:HSP20 family protein
MTVRPEWDPFQELLTVQKRMNQLFESALARTNFEASGGVDAWSPVVDVYELPRGLVVDVELPGLAPEEIEVVLDHGELVIRGQRRMEAEQGPRYHRVERSYGRFHRRIPLPVGVDSARVEASYRQGVLHVLVPNAAGEHARSRRVTVR